MSAVPQPEPPILLREDHEGIALLTMNRPQQMNLLTAQMLSALQSAFDEIASDRNVRVVILAAAGKGFCAGHDLKEIRALKEEPRIERLFAQCSRMMQTISALPQPVIARVHGIATAAGCQLVSMCDLAVAADTARFALPGVNVGIFCTTPAVGVARNVARKRVMEMLVTGEPIDAGTALEWGLVNRVVAAASLDEAVKAFTDRIVARSASVIALGKRAFYAQVDRALGDAYAVASEAMTCNLADPDAAEGIDAFLEKRSANWGAGR